MMNYKFLINISVVILFTIPAFAKGNNDKIKGNGNVTLENRKVTDFSDLELDGVFNVFIIQGDSVGVKVETDENIQKYIKVENIGNKIKIYDENEENIKKYTKMNVYVTVREIENLTMDLVGDLVIKDTLKTVLLKFKSTSVGNTEINIVTQKLIMYLNGVGDVKISGSAQVVDLIDKAVGNLKAYNLKVGRFVIDYNGVGNIDINVEKELSVNSTGVGHINYRGNPIFTTKEVTGTGLLKRVK